MSTILEPGVFAFPNLAFYILNGEEINYIIVTVTA